jgi:hypothetical protein
MNQTANDQKWKQQTVKSFRMNASNLELVKQECVRRNIRFSDFVRQSVMGNLKHTRRQAIAAWGNSHL